MTATDEALQMMLDERAIVQAMHRYCRALDYGDEQEWLDVFTADAVYDTVLPNGDLYAHLTTQAEFVEFLHAYERSPKVAPKHMMVDPIIDLDGDRARVESTFLFLLQSPGTPPTITAWGRYHDEFRREDTTWRIASRRCETEAM